MFNGCITSLVLPSKKHGREQSFIREHIDSDYIDKFKRRRAQELSKVGIRSPPLPAFNNLYPNLTSNLEMAAIRKRSRTKQAIPSPPASDAKRVWSLKKVVYDEDRGAVIFDEAVSREKIRDTLALFDIPFDGGNIVEDRVVPMTKRQYAIAQARGFAKMFEITAKSSKKNERFKTVPLTPVLLRFFLTTTHDEEVDKWNVFSAAYILTNWVLRRFLRKAVDVQSIMVSTRSLCFTEHYSNLPGVVAVVQKYLDVVQEGNVGTFFNGGIVGWSLLFSFLAVKQVDRIHHRFLEEARYLGELHGRDFVRDHHEFYALINKLTHWSDNHDQLQTSIIIVPHDSSNWNIDVEELCVLTYKLAQDVRVDSLSSVAMMLSLLSSHLDTGETVRYLDNIVTMSVFQTRKFVLLQELMFGRDPQEREEVETKMNQDIAETDVYDSRIYCEVHTVYKKKIPMTREYEGRLGLHQCTDYESELLESPPLYESAQREFDCDLLPLFSVIACIEHYYTSSLCKPVFSMDFHRAVMSSTHLLPVYNNQAFLDRAFFHV